jgi:hypothetical protein
MEWRQVVGLTGSGFILGIVLGGFLWGSSPEKKQDIQTLEVVRTQEVIREVKVVVTVEAVRTVVVEKAVKADKVIEEKKTLPDGAVTIRTETYNLGVTTREQENSTVRLGLEQSEQSATIVTEARKETKLSVSEVSAKRFSLGVVALNEWNSLTQWSYSANLAVVGMWHPADAFFVGAIAGPRYFGGMIGVRF